MERIIPRPVTLKEKFDSLLSPDLYQANNVDDIIRSCADILPRGASLRFLIETLGIDCVTIAIQGVRLVRIDEEFNFWKLMDSSGEINVFWTDSNNPFGDKMLNAYQLCASTTLLEMGFRSGDTADCVYLDYFPSPKKFVVKKVVKDDLLPPMRRKRIKTANPSSKYNTGGALQPLALPV